MGIFLFFSACILVKNHYLIGDKTLNNVLYI